MNRVNSDADDNGDCSNTEENVSNNNTGETSVIMGESKKRKNAYDSPLKKAKRTKKAMVSKMKGVKSGSVQKGHAMKATKGKNSRNKGDGDGTTSPLNETHSENENDDACFQEDGQIIKMKVGVDEDNFTADEENDREEGLIDTGSEHQSDADQEQQSSPDSTDYSESETEPDTEISSDEDKKGKYKKNIRNAKEGIGGGVKWQPKLIACRMH